MDSYLKFYHDILKRKLFYLPLIFFAIVGYSFSIYNRTVSVDDLMRDFNIGSINGMLSGRWGMVFWCKLLGLTHFDPFIDRFLAVVLYVLASIILCFLFYQIKQGKDILTYTIVSSIFVSYPLVNEIFEYTGVNFMIGGNLCLVMIAVVILLNNTFALRKRIIIASVLLLIPISSYETAIFYYIALICIIIFFKNYINEKSYITIAGWIRQFVFFCIPIVIAFVGRFAISFIINWGYNINYRGGGATEIIWLSYDFIPTLKGMIVSNFIHYGLFSLVYFPITVFVFALVVFLGLILINKNNRILNLLLGLIIILSLFFQAIIQGDLFPYRHTQTITLFVAFSTYLLCIVTRTNKKKFVYVALLCLCWYQAVYLNRILGLNNLRSDSEVAIIHKIGSTIVSEFDNKPVVFVAPYKVGEYVTRQVSFDDSTWNGRLLNVILDNLGEQNESLYKYIDSNVNSASKEYCQLQQIFNYYGYDINVIPNYISGENIEKDEKIQSDAMRIVQEKNIGKYKIYDNGDYLIVNMGGAFYKNKIQVK